MKTKPIPGPWSRDKYGCLIDASGKDVYLRSVSIACSGRESFIAEAEANTDLVAASPELLAVADRLVREGLSTSLINEAKAAIAKATGSAA